MVFVADYFKHSGNQSSDMMSQGALILPLDWQQPNQTAWTYFYPLTNNWLVQQSTGFGSMLKPNIFAGSSKHRPKHAFIHFYHGKRKQNRFAQKSSLILYKYYMI